MANRITGGPDTHLTMHVVNHIRKLIEEGKLRPGDQIPPEREFARSLKISRASLRTGIGYLAAMDVMKVRHGVGTFVTDGPPELGQLALSLLGALHGFQSWQMFEARLILESNLAALASQRGREEHFAALAEEVAEMYATVNDPGEYLIHDVRFHRTIAEAAANPILAVLMQTIATALYDQRRGTVERSRGLKSSADVHREIYRAVRSRDPAAARTAMERHLKAAERAERTEMTAVRTHPKPSKTGSAPKAVKGNKAKKMKKTGKAGKTGKARTRRSVTA